MRKMFILPMEGRIPSRGESLKDAEQQLPKAQCEVGGTNHAAASTQVAVAK
jgi:hypothetical protein